MTLFSKSYDEEEEKLHTLDVQRALTFYLEWTKPFRSLTQLFIAFVGRMQGSSVSTQSIFSWISN